MKNLLASESCKGFSSDSLPFYVEGMALEIQENLDHNKISMKESPTKVVPELPLTAAAFLDTSISCIPGLSKRQCNQLENCGFFTLQKLLPRTYADLQNAQVGIDDGQYLISVWRVLSSRGVKASSSFSFLEVFVACEVVNDKSRHTIYLHLKKLFRSSRFTDMPLPKSFENKHKLGEIVCISSKATFMVPTELLAIQHYEHLLKLLESMEDDHSKPSIALLTGSTPLKQSQMI